MSADQPPPALPPSGSEEDMEVASIRMKRSLVWAVDEFVRRDTHNTFSDFVRDAIREKIKNDAPEIFKELLKRR